MHTGHHAPRLGIALALATAVAMAGCGGSLDRETLEQSVETIASVAAEGQLLGDDVSRDRTRSTFVRAHARELADEADSQARQLAGATAPSNLAPARTRAVALAQQISSSLSRLQLLPGDEPTGRRTADELRRVAALARRLPGAS